MGTLLGHIIPGVFFTGLALWWIYSILYRYYKCHFSHQEENYRNSVTFPTSFLSKVPVEGIFKVVATFIGITGEVGTGFDGNGHWIQWGNSQHISMYFFFGFSGLMDILYFYEFNLPPNLDYGTSVIAFLMEGFLFANHLHGRTPLDVMIHTYLFYVIIGGAICAGLEGIYRTSVIPALGRAYLVLLQGTWFNQIGFILYPPPGIGKWEEDSHMEMMIATVLFTWHCATAMLIIFMFMIVIWISLRRTSAAFQNLRTSFDYQKINLTENANSLLPIITDSSEDEV